MKTTIAFYSVLGLGVIGLGALLKPLVFLDNYYSSATDTCHNGKTKIINFTAGGEFEKFCTKEGGYTVGSLASEVPEAVIDKHTFDMLKYRSVRNAEQEKFAREAEVWAAKQAAEREKRMAQWAENSYNAQQEHEGKCWNQLESRGYGDANCY